MGSNEEVALEAAALKPDENSAATGMPQQPGFYEGRHFTTYVDDVKRLKRDRRLSAAEQLLLGLVDATEAEDEVERYGVAPWYYEQLAVIYRQRKDYVAECTILERFKFQRHASGGMPATLISRLAKARDLLKS